MDITGFKRHFKGKEVQKPPLSQTDPPVSIETGTLPLVGESIDVELAHRETRISAVMMLNEFDTTENGFWFSGYFDSIQTDDEFQGQMESLLSNGEFVLAFEYDGIVFGGVCTMESYSSDELGIFKITATFSSNMAVKVQASSFCMDDYIRAISQDARDDTEDIWVELERRASEKEDILNRK